jgi:hypothetical protein
MRAKEVVVGNKKSGQGNSSIDGAETGSRAGVVFESAVETFNELFERAELFRLII